jgi:hypothetical protein
MSAITPKHQNKTDNKKLCATEEFDSPNRKKYFVGQIATSLDHRHHQQQIIIS